MERWIYFLLVTTNVFFYDKVLCNNNKDYYVVYGNYPDGKFYYYVVYGDYPDGIFDHSIFGIYKVCPNEQNGDYCKVQPDAREMRFSPDKFGSVQVYYPEDWPETLAYKFSQSPWQLRNASGAQVIAEGHIHYQYTIYEPLWYKDSFFYFSSQHLIQENAKQFCEALDGYLVSTENTDLMGWLKGLEKGYTIWTGFQFVNETWMYHVNQGDGVWLEASSSFISSFLQEKQNCAVVSLGEMQFTPKLCDDNYYKFVCQIKKHTKYENEMIRFYEKKRDFAEATSECHLVKEGSLLRIETTQEQKWLTGFMRFYKYSGRFFIDAKFDKEKGFFASSNGVRVPEQLWAHGQPNNSTECVVMDSSDGMFSTYKCDDKNNVQFACEIKDKSDNFIAIVGNTRYSSSVEKSSYSLAEKSCLEVDSTIADIRPMWKFLTAVKGFYSSSSYLTEKHDAQELQQLRNLESLKIVLSRLTLGQSYLVKAPTEYVDDMSLVLNGHARESNDQCLALDLYQKVPYFSWKNCDSYNFYMCQHDYKETIYPVDTLLCLPNFTRVDVNTCLRLYSMEVNWPMSYAICRADTFNEGSLAKYISKQNDAAAVNYFITQSNVSQSYWTGMCGDGVYGLEWKSGDATVNDRVSKTNMKQRDECLVADATTLNSHLPTRDALNTKMGFICHHAPLKKSLYDYRKIVNVSYADEVLSFFGEKEYCPVGYIAFEERCLLIVLQMMTYNNAKMYCADHRAGNIVVSNTRNKYEMLKKIITAYSWTVSFRFLINVKYEFPENYFHEDQYNVRFDNERSLGENDTNEIAMFPNGQYRVAQNHMSYPFLCETNQCYNTTPSTYIGTVNTTVNGFLCQRWDSQQPHKHNHSKHALRENYCVGYDTFGMWCYTTSTQMRWEECDVSRCDLTIVNPYPSYIVKQTKYSDFLTANGDGNIVSCSSEYILMSCKCTNSNCKGIQLQDRSSTELAVSRHEEYTCAHFTKKPDEYKFLSRSKIQCIFERDVFITRSVTSQTRMDTKIICPPLMTMYSCNFLDDSPNFYSAINGLGIIETNEQNITMCAPRHCEGKQCQTTAVCGLINKQHYRDQTSRPSNKSRVIKFHSEEVNWENKDAAFFIYPLNDIGTLCFWIKPSSSATTLGTILHLTRTHKYPVLAVAGGSKEDQNGIFIAPNGERLQYNTTMITYDKWHQMCITSGVRKNSGVSTCQLHVDAVLAAETNTEIDCNKTLLYPYGHLSFGRGVDIFTPKLYHTTSGKITRDNLNLAKVDEQLFSTPFYGKLGDISAYRKPLTISELKMVRFSCTENDWVRGIPPQPVSWQLEYLLESDMFGSVYLYGNLPTDEVTKPCNLASDLYRISLRENSIVVGSSSVKITIEIEANEHDKLKQLGITDYYVTYDCLLGSQVHRTKTISASIGELTTNITKDISVGDLISATNYRCYFYAGTSLWNQPKYLHYTTVEFKTALTKVRNIRSYDFQAAGKKSHEIVPTGSDIVTWQPPVYGNLDQYKVIAYYTLLNSTMVKITERFIHASTFEYFDIITENKNERTIPGAVYTLVISAVDEKGTEGDKSEFVGRLQPSPPRLKQAKTSKGVGENVNVRVTWIDIYKEYIDGYNLRYISSQDKEWSSVKIPSGKKKYTLIGLLSFTDYMLTLSSFAGSKTTNESKLNITTRYGQESLTYERNSATSVTLHWNVDKQCHQYQVRIEAIESMDGIPDVTNSECYFSPLEFQKTVSDIFCTETIRRFQTKLSETLDDLKTDCIYRAFVTLNDDRGFAQYTITLDIENPSELSTVADFVLVSSSESSLQFSWKSPEMSENADGFQVTVSYAETPWIIEKWMLVSEPGVIITNLSEATEYIVNVTLVREKTTAAKSVSLKVWTQRTNSLSLFTWSDWTPFSQCPQTCGSNVKKTRTMLCQNPNHEIDKLCSNNDTLLHDEVTEFQVCNLTKCPVDGQWSTWSTYTMCDKTCGGNGLQSRNRTCSNPTPAYGGQFCNGGDLYKSEIRQCGHIECPVNGGWTEWVEIFSCDAICGGGLQTRKRLCRNPIPSFGGLPCNGTGNDTIICNTEPCPVPGIWEEWSGWSICVNLCGMTNSSRKRECIISETGHFCDESNSTERMQYKSCIAPNPCKDDFHWGAWGLFTSCSKTCGTSEMRQRTRKCVWNDDIYQIARPCSDENTQKIMCGQQHCPVHGSWGEWGIWGPCSVSCERGEQLRMRLCDDPVPMYGGSDCEGSETGSQVESIECSRKQCPSGRYLNSPTSMPHCDAVVSEREISWPWTFVGVRRNHSCPMGTVGTAYRKCKQNQEWQPEDLTACVSEKVQEIIDLVENVDAGASDVFSEVSSEILQMLENDKTGNDLSVAGDILRLYDLLVKLLQWKPSSFSDLSRAAKLQYVNTITTSVEKITNSKYDDLWSSLNGTTILKMLKSFLTLIENTSAYGQDVIESDTSVIYKNNLNKDFSLLLKTVRSNGETLFTFPEDNSPEFEIESSKISIELDPMFGKLNKSDGLAKLMFVKYNTLADFMYKLNENITNTTGRRFNGRNINGVLMGAMLKYVGMDNMTDIRVEVKIEFHHPRPAKDPICVFVDERKGNWLYNEVGCRHDDIYSTPEITICMCDHLTTFAVLTHDVLDEDKIRSLAQQEFRTFYSKTSLTALVLCIVLFALVLAPTISLNSESGLPIHTVLSHCVKNATIFCVVSWSNTPATCAVTSSIFAYSCTVVVSVTMLNCLDVFMEIRCGNRRSQNNFSFIGWILPLFLMMMILGTYGLSSMEDAAPTCAEIYSVLVLLPAMTVDGFLFCMAFVILVYSLRLFSKATMKPLEANRIERRVWVCGFLVFFVGPSTVLAMMSFIDMETPTYEIQIVYVCVLFVEIFFLGVVHIWLDLEVRGYYYKKFGATPVKEKVIAQPPKYIP